MSLTWLEELLPQGVVSFRSKICWLVFFALFPLAYAGGVMLEMAQDRPARIAGAEDRPASIRTAERFAASKGIDVANWNKYAVAETRDNLLAYYERTKGPEVTAASMLAPAREVHVLFRSPDQRHDFGVYISLTGQVTGYDSGKFTPPARNVSSDVGIVSIQTNTTDEPNSAQTSGGSAKTPSDQEVEFTARQVLANNVALSKLVQLGPAKVASNEDDVQRKEVTWEVSPAGTKGLTLHISVSVRDSQVVAQHIEAVIDNGYEVNKPKVPNVFDTLYAFMLLFGAFYAAYRYAKRTLQKEISHWRTLVVAALFAISYGEFAYSIAIDQMATRISAETFAKTLIFAYVFAGITFAILGLLVGIGYGSGEGELREAYPGKLTSLDALLAGRIFSRDVAASLLFGAAAAGWLMLAQHSLGRFLKNDVTALQKDVLTYTFARLPWLTLALGRQYQSLLIAVTGLLLPASFLLRRPTRKRRRFFWLILFALLSVLDAAKNPTLGQALLATIVLASALLLPFFAFDLLAAIVSLSALDFVNELVKLTQVIPSWTPFALSLAVLALVTLAVATYLALHGRRVREEDVRPLYAKNLAERMAMQAEILAAREAQLRLLPQAAPELPGVQLAAYCLPARGVGGDFYDFFRLDANRVGIFVAQGGDQGLASALRIALAKGLLMHASQQSHSPTQIIVGLEESITELLEGSSSDISFAYGVMDTRRNLLSYARIGTSPRLVIYRDGIALNASSHLERKVIEGGRLKSAASIYEGAAQAHPGDFLIFVTDGLMSLRTRRFARRENQWIDHFMRQLGRPEEPLQTSLTTALLKYQNHAPDDLTAVVLRIMESQAVVREVVA